MIRVSETDCSSSTTNPKMIIVAFPDVGNECHSVSPSFRSYSDGFPPKTPQPLRFRAQTRRWIPQMWPGRPALCFVCKRNDTTFAGVIDTSTDPRLIHSLITTNPSKLITIAVTPLRVVDRSWLYCFLPSGRLLSIYTPLDASTFHHSFFFFFLDTLSRDIYDFHSLFRTPLWNGTPLLFRSFDFIGLRT